MAAKPPRESDLEAILERVRQARGFDFRSYKRATLQRRIERRMAATRCRTRAQYLTLLERDPGEVNPLVSSMLIKLTTFFRDREVWTSLDAVLRELVRRRRPEQELRIWSAGCATGEEAYSIAIAASEALGPGYPGAELKVFGTDVDETSIAFARRGVYSAQQLEGCSKERLERWFVPTSGGYAVRKELRRSVVFGVNNLVSDAPVSRIDLILCRNVFIYLEADLQKRVLARFHFSLRREGVLVLGRSELIPFAARLFEPLDLSRRIYRKDVRHEPSLMRQERLVDLPEALPPASPLALEPPLAPPHLLREVFDSQACPYIVTDAEGIITQWNHAAARLWNRNEAEVVGRKLASQGLPGLSPDLLVEQSARVRAGRSERELDATNRELAHRTAEMDALSFCQRTIIRTLSEAVLVLDPNGRITTWNLAAERLLGITEREVVGQSLWTLSIPALKRPLIQRLRKSLLDHRSLRLEEVPYQLPHGGRGSATVVATPLISETTVLGFVILLEDTTRLTALQQEVREFKERPKR